jgi:YHS domain-containing protein
VVDDEMVKDPVCGIYVARRSGVPLVQNGREMIFCSEECRDRYLQEQQDAGE